jgi:hypothetical protein
MTSTDDSKLRFAIIAVVHALIAFAVGRSFEASDRNVILGITVTSIWLLIWIAMSDYRPAVLARLRLPKLSLLRVFVITAVTGLGLGLGAPAIDMSSDLEDRATPQANQLETMHQDR